MQRNGTATRDVVPDWLAQLFQRHAVSRRDWRRCPPKRELFEPKYSPQEGHQTETELIKVKPRLSKVLDF